MQPEEMPRPARRRSVAFVALARADLPVVIVLARRAERLVVARRALRRVAADASAFEEASLELRRRASGAPIAGVNV